jgi:hypothetical protein
MTLNDLKSILAANNFTFDGVWKKKGRKFEGGRADDVIAFLRTVPHEHFSLSEFKANAPELISKLENGSAGITKVDFPSQNTDWRDRVSNSVLIKDSLGKSEFFWSLTENRMLTIAPNVAAHLFTKDEWSAYCQQNSRICVHSFNPYKRTLFNNEFGETCFNTYLPPYWLKDFYYNRVRPVEKVECPVEVTRHLNWLFDNNNEVIQYFLDWASNSLKTRNLTAMGLIGETEGSGKTVLAELLAAVHGVTTKNWLVKGDVFLSKFNAFVDDCTFSTIDELAIDTDGQYNRFKSLFNDHVSVERKGLDSVTVNNYTNILFTSNNLDCIKISASDRRMSILDVTSKALKDHLSSSDLSKWINSLKDPDVINRFGLYLFFNHKIKSNLSEPYIGKTKEEMRYSRLKDWEIAVLEWADNNPGLQVNLKDIIEDIIEIKELKIKPGRRSFERLQRQFPYKIKVVRVFPTSIRELRSVVDPSQQNSCVEQNSENEGNVEQTASVRQNMAGELVGKTGENTTNESNSSTDLIKMIEEYEID